MLQTVEVVIYGYAIIDWIRGNIILGVSDSVR